MNAEEHIKRAQELLASAAHSYNNESRVAYGALATAHIAMATYIKEHGAPRE